jgi:diadenylate cyclase
MSELLNEIAFLFQRLNWLSVVDLFLVTIIFYGIFLAIKDTQAMVLLRGVFFLVILISLLTALVDLPAFSWLVKTSLPALLLAIPVVFAPEIRRGLERLGRAGSRSVPLLGTSLKDTSTQTIKAVVVAAARLSARQHGALIVFQRRESLKDYIASGVQLNAVVTPELLLQTFYPNTPLHDGAVVITGDILTAASCVMPLSSSGILHTSPERQMGLRHRAALGISENSDAVVVVVSEESGSISVVRGGRIIRKLDSERLENILVALLQKSDKGKSQFSLTKQLRKWLGLDNPEDQV